MLQAPIFDTHAHYFDARFEREYPGGGDALLNSILPDPVVHIVNVGTNLENSRAAIEQARRHPGMFAAVGIHPEDCHSISDEARALESLRLLLGDAEVRRRDRIVALGEIGLDYHYESYGDIPLDRQRELRFFEAQMDIAESLGLPVIVHDREAHRDCFEAILRHPNVRGVFHSFSGSAELAQELVKRGWYLSFSGTLTFQNARRVREAAAAIPKDRLLIETDAPYLAPHPVRGTLNRSDLLTYTLATLAQLWDCTVPEAAYTTFENAVRFFQIENFSKDAQKSSL